MSGRNRPTKMEIMMKAKPAVWLFAMASLFSIVAALLPVLKGDPPNVVFLGLGSVSLILSMVIARKARSDGAPPSA